MSHEIRTKDGHITLVTSRTALNREEAIAALYEASVTIASLHVAGQCSDAEADDLMAQCAEHVAACYLVNERRTSNAAVN